MALLAFFALCQTTRKVDLDEKMLLLSDTTQACAHDAGLSRSGSIVNRFVMEIMGETSPVLFLMVIPRSWERRC